jgi:antitoxin VapB
VAEAGNQRKQSSVASVYIEVYTERMADRAKLFKNGGSQAVRLPANCRFPDDQREVSVKRIGRKVILEPLDQWPESFKACLGAWQEGIERPSCETVNTQRDPFDS